MATGTVPACCWSKQEMRKLMDQAESFLARNGSDEISLCYITRDKTHKYFNDIFRGDKIMRKYVKDRDGNPLKPYGSPESPINYGLEGLFFSAKVMFSTGEPFDDSVYGPRRLQLPITKLLFEDDTKKTLYFADFYCMRTSSSDCHNVTLVICKHGSHADRFCKAHLVQLDFWDNSFLILGKYGFRVTKHAYVEIFYTEDLDISQYREYMTTVECLDGRRIGDPEKDTTCRDCNIQHK